MEPVLPKIKCDITRVKEFMSDKAIKQNSQSLSFSFKQYHDCELLILQCVLVLNDCFVCKNSGWVQLLPRFVS